MPKSNKEKTFVMPQLSSEADTSVVARLPLRCIVLLGLLGDPNISENIALMFLKRVQSLPAQEQEYVQHKYRRRALKVLKYYDVKLIKDEAQDADV